ncbi:hypothetical protein [uncultured Chitinophaga sp.]|uniref:hypothetical protein n=1 Tax=uncultured Chitinophaga sp. TaxID=339340 RepID=UPI0025F5D37A|nr:hypothetical protein [uncultured Chitinophaga sp.]
MKHFIFLVLWLLGAGCGQTSPETSDEKPPTSASKTEKQLNLTILLDLSDRIDPKLNSAVPAHIDRDSILISYFTKYFLDQMEKKGSFMAKGKMRIIFHPNPPDAGINQAVKNLNIDLSKMDTKGKKVIYDNLRHTVTENISSIYRTAVRQAVWPGSDIWRFFKNDVKEIAVDEDEAYRNLIVVFTDGYIYHQDSRDVTANRYAYLLPDLFDKYKLRNNQSWAAEMDKQDFGLISTRADLQQLEVLVLEVSPSARNKNDEDVIRKVMEKWFGEMKVARFKVLSSDLPEMTMQKVERFLKG